MIDKLRLQEKAQGIFKLDDQQAEMLKSYAELLVDYNQKVNLTAIVKPQEIEDKHFIDCLYLAANPLVKGSMCDVGSGAGFPGLVVAIVRPDIKLTLVEPTAKRCKFLEFVCKELKIDATIVNGRAEEVGRKDLRETFDIVTARAVASLPVLLEYCLPLCKVGGSFVAMKGDAESLVDGSSAAKLLGAKPEKEQRYSLPQGDERKLIIYTKKVNTAKLYPRNGGVIAKRPLA